MLASPMDILTAFPVRKSKMQKQAFRDAVQSYMSNLGYNCTMEKGSFDCHNIVIGDPKTAKYLVTAHYDTCARLPFPNLITPCNLFPFVLYQLFQVVYIFVAAMIPGVVIGVLVDNPGIGGVVFYFTLLILYALMLVGPANKHNANDNTSGVITVLEIARTLPQLHRDKVCFVLFDLEEAGLVGSTSYRNAHRQETEHQIVLNMDCVGDGDEIMFFPTKKLRKDKSKMQWLYRAIGRYGSKTVDVREKGFAFYPLDQTQFPYGVGIAAFRRSKWAGLYYSRIHTPKDTILEETNVNLLRACLSTLISGGKEERSIL